MTTATATATAPTITNDCAELLRLARRRVGRDVAKATKIIADRYAKGFDGGRNPIGGDSDDVPVDTWCFGGEAELVGRFGSLDLYRVVHGQAKIDKATNTVSFPLAVKLVAVGRCNSHPWSVRIDK